MTISTKVSKLEKNVDLLTQETITTQKMLQEFMKGIKSYIDDNENRWEKRDKEWEEYKKQRDKEWEKRQQEWEEYKKQRDKEWEKRQQEWEEYKKENQREWKKWKQQWGNLAVKMGTLVEDIILPSLLSELKTKFNCQPDDIEFSGIRIKKKNAHHNQNKEFDTIIICKQYFLINETKSKPDVADIKQFHEFIQSGKIYEFFPEAKQKTLVPVFSSLNLRPELIHELTNRKILAMHLGELDVEIINFNKLKHYYLQE